MAETSSTEMFVVPYKFVNKAVTRYNLTTAMGLFTLDDSVETDSKTKANILRQSHGQLGDFGDRMYLYQLVDPAIVEGLDHNTRMLVYITMPGECL